MNKGVISIARHNHQSPYQNQLLIDQLVKETILAGLGVKQSLELTGRLPRSFSVLIKPNWVLDKPRSDQSNMECLITNKSVLISILRFLDELKPGRVIIGDSPIQKCDFNNIVTEDLRRELAGQIGCDVSIRDFRQFIPGQTGNFRAGLIPNRDLDEYVTFNLYKNSCLEPVTSRINKFQITNYDVGKLNKHHRKGFHEYLVCKEVLSSDLIMNVPKLKMHAKAGYTGALKNFIGCVGDKMYLPHHRFGGTTLGGDCYPGLHLLKLFAEICSNKGNHAIPDLKRVAFWDKNFRALIKLDRQISCWTSNSNYQIFEGSWKGNDTIWRTVLDVFKIIEHGTLDGTISKEKQRLIWTLTDALICGEGQGPLNPSPFNLGLLTFSESPPMLDLFHGLLVGYQPCEVNFLDALYKIVGQEVPDVIFEGNRYDLSQAVEKLKVNLVRPKYWESN